MDALLGDDCVNDRCHALKFQTAEEAAKCTKKTQVPGEVVGRGGECEFTPVFLWQGIMLADMFRFAGLASLPGVVDA
jgi:hypothetical protein